MDRWPSRDQYYEPEAGVRVLVHEQHPEGPAKGELILVHGLEGSSDSGYARSMAAAALNAGYITHRYNMPEKYHSGMTGPVKLIGQARKQASGLPVFAAGYSLGGNVVLKMAGELGEAGKEIFAGICSVSAPIDLAESVRQIETKQNRIYHRRFVDRLKHRARRGNLKEPDKYPSDRIEQVQSIYEFDDNFTAKLFGFETAANYYRTQSANQYLERIRIPTLVITAKDDPMVPFRIYDVPALRTNPALTFLPVEHGGHLGFLARGRERLWLDHVLLDWLEETRNRAEQASSETRTLE